jgi:hypothetical protein
MIAVSPTSGEEKPVVRELRGVIWCPFCDRSMQIGMAVFCQGCHAEFKSDEQDVSSGAPAAAPRTRRRASEAVEEAEPQAEEAVEVVEADAEVTESE